MSDFKKSQVLVLSLLLALLFIAPLLSSSVRPTYLYFIFNLLILSLGAEAGVLSSLSKPQDDKKHNAHVSCVTRKTYAMATTALEPTYYDSFNAEENKTRLVDKLIEEKPSVATTKTLKQASRDSAYYTEEKQIRVVEESIQEKPKKTLEPASWDSSNTEERKTKVAEKFRSEKIPVGDDNDDNDRVKKCMTPPSIFFIGCGEPEEASVAECYEDDEEVVGEISGQELFAKAETFIGNFYKQLKMQREDSWRKMQRLRRSLLETSILDETIL